MAKTRKKGRDTGLSAGDCYEFIDEIFGDSLHVKRVESLANGVAGVLESARLSIHAIGAAYAGLAEIQPKHGIKQVDRYLSNAGFSLRHLLPVWAQFVVGPRDEVVIALDWTEFDDDDHATIAAYVMTTHGRATPLAWKTVRKSSLKERRNEYEDELIDQIHEALPAKTRVILLADRGFGDQNLYARLQILGWDFIIRFRGIIHVEHAGETRQAAEWVPASGRAKMLKGEVFVTNDRAQIPAVVVAWDRKMKEPWCLATTLSERQASKIVTLYGKRFTIEETFRDQKDLRFGMGLRATHIGNTDRRDRLLFLAAIAHALLTLLGAAAERAGLDKYLRANTVKRRTHSLFRQGVYWYGVLPNMRDDWFEPLMRHYEGVLREHSQVTKILASI